MIHRLISIPLIFSTFFFSYSMNASLELQVKAKTSAQQESEDAFSWQNQQHFNETLNLFSALAEKEFNSIIDTAIEKIDQSEDFFTQRYDSLLTILQQIIFNWMTNDILVYGNFTENEMFSNEESDHSLSGDDAWRVSYMEGFDRCTSYEESCEELSDEDQQESTNNEFEEWQREQLFRVLGIYVETIEEFTQDSIDIHAIKKFLECSVSDGYSWLLNEELEGSLLTGHDFVDNIYESVGVKKELLLGIFEGLWFDYDWEEFSIENQLFIAQTYKATLLAMKEGQRAGSIKEHIVGSIEKLFTFNADNFKEPFSVLKKNYNKFVQQKNWLKALIEWSVYSTYRKFFASPPKRSSIHSYSTKAHSLPIFETFNQEESLLNKLKEAHERACATYTKVYLHPSTEKMCFIDDATGRSELLLAEKLANLKKVGMRLEPSRPKGSENVFVPELYIIVQKNVTGPEGAPMFIQVPLIPRELEVPVRPLTRRAGDNVFIDHSDDYYYARVKEDYVRGRTIQGENCEKADELIQKKIDTNGSRTTELVHSERVSMELLRNRSVITKMVSKLSEEVQRVVGGGNFTVHGVVMLAYSTNSVCPQCTPTLIALMNSHEPGGFMCLLTQELVQYEGPTRFSVPGYSEETKAADWAKFRCNIVVTAKINFDCQAHDLTEEGQHLHTQVSKPNKNHIPEAPLVRPDGELVISDIPELDDGSPDMLQRFFFEFVGKDVHTNDLEEKDFDGVVFSSGSTSW